MGGHVACMGQKTDLYGVLVEQSNGERPLGISRRIWDLSGKSSVESCGIHSSEFLGSIICREFLDHLRTLCPLKKDSAPPRYLQKVKVSWRKLLQSHWNICYSPRSFSWRKQDDYLSWSLFRNYNITLYIIFRTPVIRLPLQIHNDNSEHLH
jgi:hypothetical protein